MLQSIAWQLTSSIAGCLRIVAPRWTIAVAGSSACAYSTRRMSPKRVHSHIAPQFSKSFFGAPKHVSAFRALMPRPLFVSIAQSGDLK